MSDKCPICGEYQLFRIHTCNPSYFVFIDDNDSIYSYLGCGYDPKYWYASDHETAAVKYAESDYEFPGDFAVFVIETKVWFYIMEKNETMDWDDEKELERLEQIVISKSKKFEMESEIVRNFYAHEIK
jgi:hypothetical protein